MAKHAIVIGIGTYLNEYPLLSAAEDARRFCTVLEGQNVQAALQPKDRWTVYPVIAKGVADSYVGSQLHVHNVFKSWVEWVNLRPDQDRSHILIYFAGHGAKRKDGGVELLASDHPWITLRNLARSISALKARNVTVILDCCYSGRLDVEFSQLAQTSGASRDGRAVFAACSEDEEAVGYRDKSGAFTNLILKGLGADLSLPAGPVTAGSLEAYVKGNWDSLPEEVRSKHLIAFAPRPVGSDDIPLVSLVRESAPEPRIEDAARAQPAAATVDGPRGNIRAERTSDGVQIYGIARMTGQLHPWRIRVSLGPSERLLAITNSSDGSTAWLVVSDESATHVVRVRQRGSVQRLVVPGVIAARSARFEGDDERGLLVLETASGPAQQVWVRTLRPSGELGAQA